MDILADLNSFVNEGDPMRFARYLVSPEQLWSRVGTAQAPMILDVRRGAIYEA
jgi:hypothetical protein